MSHPLRPPIPKRIIQTAKDRNLSLRQRATVQNLRLLNPYYEYRFFDDADVEEFVGREFPEYRLAFDRFPVSIQRYDFFRYLAVYRLGGFYFDLDVLLVDGLEVLRPTGCVFPFEGLTLSTLLRRCGIDWEIGNYAFGAYPGHPFLKAVIENCVKAQTDPAWARMMMQGVPPLSRRDYGVLTTTGPGQLTRTLAENLELAGTVKVLFPDDICDPRSWNTFGSFGVHLMEGTWRPPRNPVLRKIANTWEGHVVNRLAAQCRSRGALRYLENGATPPSAGLPT